jgi:putative heme-binding domain-containing protein
MLLTCDWGRSEVFSHRLPAHGPTFDAQQDSFLQIPRPTDADADAFGRLFVSSWKNGGFAFERPDVGFVALITPRGFIPRPPQVPAELSDDMLVRQLAHPSDAMRLHVQREILRRPALPNDLLRQVALDGTLPLTGRVAALWTLRQKDPAAFRGAFVALMMHPELQEHVLRAAADRRNQIDKSLLGPIYARLDDANPRVRAAAIVAIARSGDARAAKQLLALTERTEPAPAAEGDAWRKADPGRVLPHLAVQALVDLRAIEPCLQALDGPHRSAALAVLRRIHDPATVDGLFSRLATTWKDSERSDLWAALIRLYHREGDFTPDSPGWWGTRPDTTGPVYHRQTWSESERIAAAIKVALQESSPELRETLQALLKKHVVNIEGTAATPVMAETQQAIKVPQADPGNPDLIANLNYETVLQRTLAVKNADPAHGAELFRQQACINCHTYANGQQPRGPHLVDIGKRYKPAELVESIVQPGRRIAQGFDTWAIAMQDGKIHTGFIVLESAETVTLRDATGIAKDVIREQIEDRVKQEISMMPQGIVGNLTPEQLADLLAWLATLH